MARTKDTTSRGKRILQQQEISSAKKRVIIDPPSEDNKLVIDVCTSSSVKPNEPVLSQIQVRVVCPKKRIYPNAFNITVPCEEEGNVINIPLPKHTPIKKTWSRKLKQIFKSSCEESKVDVGLPGSLMVYNRNYWEIKEDS